MVQTFLKILQSTTDVRSALILSSHTSEFQFTVVQAKNGGHTFWSETLTYHSNEHSRNTT
jgi:hypothetical protein